MDPLKIDGSFGEGGGQILRSAVTLSCVTKRPIQINNIRQNRKPAGLKPQHLTTIKILAKICNATVEGLHVGSTLIKFYPNDLQNMRIKENVGTAGSIPLVLQALIPTISIAKKKLELYILGGTDVLWSPTMDYTKYVLAEAYARIGIEFSLKIQKRGYYPKGGGIAELTVFPCKKLQNLVLTKRDKKDAQVICTYSKVDSKVLLHAVDNVQKKLEKNGFAVRAKINEEDAIDRGASLLVFNHDLNSIIGADELFDHKRKMEFGTKSTTHFLDSELGVDSHLSDMLVIPLSLTDGISIFTVKEISSHLETNLYITSKITGCKYGIGKIKDGFEVRIEGNSDSRVQ